MKNQTIFKLRNTKSKKYRRRKINENAVFENPLILRRSSICVFNTVGAQYMPQKEIEAGLDGPRIRLRCRMCSDCFHTKYTFQKHINTHIPECQACG